MAAKRKSHKSTSLGRLFAITGAVVAVLLAGTSGGLYYAAGLSLAEAETGAMRAMAESTARNLGQAMAQADALLEQWTHDPELAAALASNNSARIQAAEERLTRLFPGALLVRLVPNSLDAPDETRSPHLGFADLEMVRQARSGTSSPAFHAANTPNAHIALARRLEKGEGVVLASLSPKLLAALLPANQLPGALDLKQQELTLGYAGNMGLKDIPAMGQVPVPGTPWTLHYRSATQVAPELLWFLLVPGGGALLMAGTIGFAWYWLNRLLQHDLNVAVAFVRDLSLRPGYRKYEFWLEEMGKITVQLSPENQSVFAAVPVPKAPEPEPEAFASNEESEEGFDRFSSIIAELSTPAAAAPPPPPASEPPPVTIAPTIFRPFDIRGVMGETLTVEVARLLGRAIGSEARQRGETSVVIGRDARLSSPDLSHALGRGLLSSGCSVIDLGLVPTPLLYFATHTLEAKSGVMVSGGYHRSNENGFKMVIGGEPASPQDWQKLRARLDQGEFTSGQGRLDPRNLSRDYIERIVHDAQLSRAMKVVVDCGNGAASLVTPTLLEQLGCEVIPLFCEADGNFPNHPANPSHPKNLEALSRAVLEREADLGVAFDADGDRLGVVDSAGRIVWPDRQLMLLAADVLSREPGSDIIYDVKCTRHLSGFIVRHGGRPLMWKTGQPLIRAKMRDTDAMLAGEMSGHFYFKERWFGFDDAIYACARLLEILSSDWRNTAEVFGDLANSVTTPELTVPMPTGEAVRLVDAVRDIADFPDARLTDIDGVRVDFADGWGLVRAANSRPALVMRFEGDTAEALERIKGEFKALLKHVKPDISLPPTF